MEKEKGMTAGSRGRPAADDEAMVDRLVQEGNTEAALKLLHDLVVKHARSKNFARAEILSAKFYDVDPMALNEIIRANEIIEEEKKVGIDRRDIDIWSDLFSLLSTEEANALYYAMEERVFEPNQPVFKQGDLTASLYFVKQGDLKLVYFRDNHETFVKTVTTGAIVGHETFFEASVCTLSLIALSRAKVKVLEQKALDSHQDEFPALRNKLLDHCIKLGKVEDLLKEKGKDRRRYKRFQMPGKVQLQLVKGSGEPIGKPFRGEMADISAGGVSCFIKSSRKETAQMLLGRKLQVEFHFGKLTKAVLKSGTVIGVRYHMFNDYSLHLKFDRDLNENALEAAWIRHRTQP